MNMRILKNSFGELYNSMTGYLNNDLEVHMGRGEIFFSHKSIFQVLQSKRCINIGKEKLRLKHISIGKHTNNQQKLKLHQYIFLVQGILLMQVFIIQFPTILNCKHRRNFKSHSRLIDYKIIPLSNNTPFLTLFYSLTSCNISQSISFR